MDEIKKIKSFENFLWASFPSEWLVYFRHNKAILIVDITVGQSTVSKVISTIIILNADDVMDLAKAYAEKLRHSVEQQLDV